MKSETADPFKKNQADLQARDLSGKFSKLDPPLVSFSLTNPLTYIRKWWKAVMAGEGVDIRLKIHPLTAVAIVLAVGGVSFGIGRVGLVSKLTKYIPFLATPSPEPQPTPNPWRQAAFTGSLQKQGDRFYLLGTNSSQAITLDIPNNVNLAGLVGRAVLAAGLYDANTMVLRVAEASDLELITGSQPIPTITPSVSPMPTSKPVKTPEPAPVEGDDTRANFSI